MRTFTAIVAMMVVPLVTALSCARFTDAPARGSADEPSMVEPTIAEGAATGLLTVTFEYARRTGLYAEGARHYLQVTDDSGDVVLRRDEGTEQGPGAGYTDSARLEPGHYTVQTYQRGCDYTEGSGCRTTTGPRMSRCTAPVTIRRGAETAVTITVRLPRPCTVKVGRGG